MEFNEQKAVEIIEKNGLNENTLAVWRSRGRSWYDKRRIFPGESKQCLIDSLSLLVLETGI
jgi:hypothetical protein